MPDGFAIIGGVAGIGAATAAVVAPRGKRGSAALLGALAGVVGSALIEAVRPPQPGFVVGLIPGVSIPYEAGLRVSHYIAPVAAGALVGLAARGYAWRGQTIDV